MRALPQSNQRGIETGVRVRVEIVEGGGLNRTSVGLKPGDKPPPPGDGEASIEPAWD